ncbi:hypothetical protein SISNIDRAFT_467616 [Sistotremastrum niveocremeum HHB9708]|uniref:G-protein coupled receptors family 1 profile domain-containing protein n=1 Tax=Sistotremastrum niveocremeum HHB9708 TaxID=1314777 RepID=A0A164SPT5_9AGAM|nr:hypothetical protein SISNIDRAFT_467616 [Sistotremastrum niveocremeum HHB9708]
MEATGVVPYAELYHYSDARGTFTKDILIGLGFSVAAAILSTVSWQTYRIVHKKDRYHFEWPTDLQLLFVSLLLFDLIQSIGAVLNIIWMLEKGVVEGPICTAQGVLRQLGQVGVALSILAIAIRTWGMIVKEWSRPPPELAVAIVVVIWVFTLLMSVLQLGVHKEVPFFGSTKYWCWISPQYGLTDSIAFSMAWIWLATVIEIVLYVSVAYTIYERRLPFNLGTLRPGGPRSMAKIAFQMTWYPVIYVVTVVPMSINRAWQLGFPNHPPPYPFTATALILFTLSGLFNVVLFTFTRPTLIPNAGSDHESPCIQATDISTLAFRELTEENSEDGTSVI